MAQFKVEWMEKKGDGWIVATLSDGTNKTTDVSINERNKKGEIFPNFNAITLGGTVEGDLWQSSAGKWYLFAPKAPKQGQGGVFKAKVIEEAQVRKESSINRTMDRKEESIKLSSAQRDAVLIVTTFYKDSGIDAQEIKEQIVKWRDWFLSEDFNTTIPF